MCPAPKDSPTPPESSPQPPPTAVFRLAWTSRYQTLLSAPLLRDHYLTTPLPPPHTPAAVPLLHVTAYVTLIRATLLQSHTSPDTTAYLLPPLPPSLTAPRLHAHTSATFRDDAFVRILALALAGHPLLSQLALPAPGSFLVHAPAGAGKSSCVARVAHDASTTLVRLSATEVLRHASSRAALLDTLLYFLRAARAAEPAILLLDDAHFVFPPDDPVAAAAFVHLCRVVTGYRRDGVVVVLVACVTPAPHVIHPAVVGASDVVLPLGLDSCGEWAVQLASDKTGVPPERVAHALARRTSVSLADTLQLAKKLSFSDAELGSDDEQMDSDMTARWERLSTHLGGLTRARNALRRVLLFPYTKADSLRRLRIQPAKGVLLYGPPGTGKTHLIREAAVATNHFVFPVDAAGLARGEVGASERLLVDAFAQAERAAPCVMFLDEIDALFAAGALNRLVAVLSRCIDRATRLVVVGATNRPWMVSKALLRPGRFEHIVKVPLPNAAERRDIGMVYAAKMRLEADSEARLRQLASESDGFSGADIAGACRRAAMSALCRGSAITVDDLTGAFFEVEPSVKQADALRIEAWRA